MEKKNNEDLVHLYKIKDNNSSKVIATGNNTSGRDNMMNVELCLVCGDRASGR